MSTSHISFTVPGEPRGKGRPRFNRKSAKPYKDTKTASYENLICLAWKAEHGRRSPHKGPVRLKVASFHSIPTSRPKWWKSRAEGELVAVTKIPDLDNILKCVLDGLDKVAFCNDSQVCGITATKRYSLRPRLEVELTFLEVEKRSTTAS